MTSAATRLRRTPWWYAYLTAFAVLAAIDVMLRAWTPHPQRLPEQFSGGYLERYVSSLRAIRDPVIVMGDSTLWGFKIAAADSSPAVLARALPSATIINLSYEGGSPVNSEVLLRYLLRVGVRPRLVIFNVNEKEFNPADSAFKRLRPALQIAAADDLTEADRKELEFLNRTGINDRLGDVAERYWALYRYRTDIREALFGTDDIATLLTKVVGGLSGATSRKAQADAPTAERFLGTYDLTPLTPANLSYQRLAALASLLSRSHIKTIAFLTPANHRLLHDYIDNAAYAANLATAKRALDDQGVTTLDLDSAMPPNEFIDNDHLTSKGSRHLAGLLQPAVERALQ